MENHQNMSFVILFDVWSSQEFCFDIPKLGCDTGGIDCDLAPVSQSIFGRANNDSSVYPTSKRTLDDGFWWFFMIFHQKSTKYSEMIENITIWKPKSVQLGPKEKIASHSFSILG